MRVRAVLPLIVFPLVVIGSGIGIVRVCASVPATGPFPIESEPVEMPDPPGTGTPADPVPASPQVRLWFPAGSGSETAGVPFAPASPVPLIVCFPDWTGTQIDNRSLVRELVSHGFAVATVVYPVGAAASQPMQFSSEAAFRATLQEADRRVRARALDAVAVLDRLADLDAADPAARLHGRLDSAHAGIFGYSFGGAVAAEAAWVDRRFRAVVNLDGWAFADAAEHGVEQPYLLFSDDTPVPGADDLRAADPVLRNIAIVSKSDYDRSIAQLRRNGGLYATISGTRHVNFSDAALRVPFRSLTGGGPIDPRRALAIVNAYVLAFFDRQLRGSASALLAGDSPEYPEVRLRIFGAPAQS